ncbi:TPA: phage tail protein [Yersinia enterocolitica]
MPDFMTRLKSLRLPSWMDKGEPSKLLRICRRWWQWVHGWLSWPLNQLDAATCTVPLLNVLAYQRDISRFNGEPLSLYRKRVQYAFINAADAGSVAGFIAIFERLGIGYVELLERQPDIDWDVILVRVSDSQIASNSDLLMQIIRQYGKTCRRYRFEVITVLGLRIRAGWIGNEYVCYSASSGVATSTAAAATTFTASLTGKK